MGCSKVTVAEETVLLPMAADPSTLTNLQTWVTDLQALSHSTVASCNQCFSSVQNVTKKKTRNALDEVMANYDLVATTSSTRTDPRTFLAFDFGGGSENGLAFSKWLCPTNLLVANSNGESKAYSLAATFHMNGEGTHYHCLALVSTAN